MNLQGELPLSKTLPWRSVGGTIFGMPTALRSSFNVDYVKPEDLHKELQDAGITFSSVPVHDDPKCRNIMVTGEPHIRTLLKAGADIDSDMERLVTDMLV